MLQDFKSVGWLLLVVVVATLGIMAWFALPRRSDTERAVGDGRSVESYGFDLSNLRVPHQRLVAAGIAKDQMPALTDPAVMNVAAVAEFNAEHRGKYVVPSDRVIGVTLGGEARAYPLRLLNWHEVINDTLGGQPIAVTYHPLCDSVVVFDRRVSGETLNFGVSGLLHNSNLVMYDRQRDGQRAESLWSQLLAQAIAGPAAETASKLRVLPASLARWGHWLQVYPDTTIVAPDPAKLKPYQRNPYGKYFLTGRPRFPVEPLPDQQMRDWMTRMLIIDPGGGPQAMAYHPFSPTAQLAGIDWDLEGDIPSAVLAQGTESPTIYSLWFAWYAHHAEGASAPVESAILGAQ